MHKRSSSHVDFTAHAPWLTTAADYHTDRPETKKRWEIVKRIKSLKKKERERERERDEHHHHHHLHSHHHGVYLLLKSSQGSLNSFI